MDNISSSESIEAVVLYMRQSWKGIIAGAALGFVCAALWLAIVPWAYTAKMMVAATPSGTIATRAAPGDESWSRRELVDLVQRSSGNTLSDFDRFLNLMTSVSVAEKLLQDQNLKNSLFKVQAFPQDSYMLAAYFQQHILMKMIGTSPIWQITFRFPQRNVALELLAALHHFTDQLLRDQARQRVQEQISFLNGRLSSVLALEQRAIIARQLAEQENALMMVSVNVPFAAEMLQPPFAPPDPDWPSATWILCISAMIGTGLALAVQGLRKRCFYSKDKDRAI